MNLFNFPKTQKLAINFERYFFGLMITLYIIWRATTKKQQNEFQVKILQSSVSIL